jgi:K+-transporting ATPase ATPase B chain
MRDAIVKLNPPHAPNPVMFVVLIGSVLSTLVLMRDSLAGHTGTGFTVQLVLWLWFTVVFANFAEAMAEGRGKAQADALRASRTQTHAKRLDASDADYEGDIDKLAFELALSSLRKGTRAVHTGRRHSQRRQSRRGVASVDESASPVNPRR